MRGEFGQDRQHSSGSLSKRLRDEGTHWTHSWMRSWYHSGKAVDLRTTERVDIKRWKRPDQPLPSTSIRYLYCHAGPDRVSLRRLLEPARPYGRERTVFDSSSPIVGFKSNLVSSNLHVSGSHCCNAPEKLVSMYRSLIAATLMFASRSWPRRDQIRFFVPSVSCDMMCRRARWDRRQGVCRLNSTPVVEPEAAASDKPYRSRNDLERKTRYLPRHSSLFIVLPSQLGS